MKAEVPDTDFDRPQAVARVFPWQVPVVLAIAAAAVLAPARLLGFPKGHDLEFHLPVWIDVRQQWSEHVFWLRWDNLAQYGEASLNREVHAHRLSGDDQLNLHAGRRRQMCLAVARHTVSPLQGSRHNGTQDPGFAHAPLPPAASKPIEIWHPVSAGVGQSAEYD